MVLFVSEILPLVIIELDGTVYRQDFVALDRREGRIILISRYSMVTYLLFSYQLFNVSMDLSRRDTVKYGALGVLGAVSLGKRVQDQHEVSEQVTKRMVSDREFAEQQIQELENSYQEAVQGESGVVDSTELMGLLLGNPNHFEDFSREEFISDTENLLESHSVGEAFRIYAEENVDEIPFTSIQASLLLDQTLDLDLVYLDQGGEFDENLSNGVETVEAEIGQVLPSEYELSVDSRIVDPGVEVEEVLKSVSEEPKEGILNLNELFDYNKGSTLPVYIFEPREFDRLSSVARLDFSEMWVGYGAPEGSLVALPSKLLRTGEDQFYETLVHEIGHSAFELPHSAVNDDVMTYNSKADNPTGFTTSQLLIQSYLDSELEFREEERNGERGIYFQQQPGKIPQDEAVDAFFANLNAYITDMVDEFDLDPGKFEDTSYERRDGFDVAQYHDYNETGVGMEITVDGLIHDIQQTS